MFEEKLSRRKLLALSAVMSSGISLARAEESLSISRLVGSGTDDDLIALAAETSVKERRSLVIDRPVRLTRAWTPPTGLILRGDWSEQAVIFCFGTNSGIDIRGSIDIDGVTIDGGIDPTSDRSAGEFGCLVAIRGRLAPAATYLEGVAIGRLRIRHTRRVGIVLSNLDSAQIGQLELVHIFCHALILSGIRNSTIERIDADDIGDLKASGHRRGSAVAMMAETKPVAPWYETKFILPTDSLRIKEVKISKTTDSAFYIHDELHTGVTNVIIDRIHIHLAGKDGFKTRAGPKGVRIGSIETKQVALRGVDIESDDVKIQHIDISECGFDAVGEILGHPAAFTGKDGTGQSIQSHPNGIVIMDCRNVELPDFSIRNVLANPAKGSEGHGLSMAGATNVKAKGTIAHCDASGLHIAGSSDFNFDVTVSDTCRKPPNNKPIRFASDGRGISRRGRISGSVEQAVGGPASQIVGADAVCEVDVNISYNKSQFPARDVFRGDPGRSCEITEKPTVP